MSFEEKTGIVIDNGSSQIKAGFAGDDQPNCVIPNISGSSASGNDHYVGNDAQNKRDILNISCPVYRGIIEKWDEMEKIWHHIFVKELHCTAAGNPVFISESPLSPKSTREGTAKLMFEKFNVSSLYISPDPVLSMYAQGAVSGLVFSSGHGVTSVYPIYEGYPIPEGIRRIDYGGLDITELVSKSLSTTGDKSVGEDIFIAKDIKESLCFVSVDYKKDTMKKTEEVADTYKLPDGRIISLDKARFECTEPFFQPSNFGLEHSGPSALFRKVIMELDVDVRKSLCDNIVLAGGNTKFPGFIERLDNELKECMPKSLPFSIRGQAVDRTNTVWIGMSMVACMSNYKAKWISKQEYEEHGPSVIHKNCV